MDNQEVLKFDVIIIGGGPAGLSAAIKLLQIDQSLSVCVLEKSAQIGGHLVSGAVIEPTALDALLPQWRDDANCPLNVPVKKDQFYYFSKRHSWRMPTPPQMKNHGNYIISLSKFSRYLAAKAEALGVQIFPGFSAAKPIIEAGKLCGVVTGEMGLDHKGNHGPNYQPGMHLQAPVTFLAEGAHGSITKALIKHFDLRDSSKPQTYAIGLKEVWEVSDKVHQEGLVWHSIGWPLPSDTYGGSFVYHDANQRVSLGYVIGLDYQNPYLNPYATFQQFKHHPKCLRLLQDGKRIAYGARALTEGGWQSLPKLAFPGGRLIGCSAGLVNTPKIKGIHNAMWSGMIAAENWMSHQNPENTTYDEALRESRVGKELYKVRNIRPGFKKGLWTGLANAGLETLTMGHTPWTMSHHTDHLQIKLKKDVRAINYPKPDGIISFDILTSVRLTGTNHAEDQPCHLQLADKKIPIDINYYQYDSPETRYCPAKVYEIVKDDAGKPRLQINAQNCIHCKTCDIKDLKQNINWVPPQGGEGPNYSDT
ncbi:MAG: electron transfer flavoprotein-ubiquinone oxidoreductase [Pseudomonadota bacterium]|nr:electron transfer flavoprotein-ubiquinone oxidoreductase [Pseudomonadota bacterium]